MDLRVSGASSSDITGCGKKDVVQARLVAAHDELKSKGRGSYVGLLLLPMLADCLHFGVCRPTLNTITRVEEHGSAWSDRRSPCVTGSPLPRARLARVDQGMVGQAKTNSASQREGTGGQGKAWLPVDNTWLVEAKTTSQVFGSVTCLL